MDRAEPTYPAEIGEVIGGYRLERLLGSGGTSRVFLGRHVHLSRVAAVKVLNPDLIEEEKAITRFLTEAKVVNDIHHENIIDIFDFINSEQPRRCALIMERIEGPSLKACRGKLSFYQALKVMLQLLSAIEAAHQAGVIHRDLKPDNLLLSFDPKSRLEVPTLKVVDFGVAKIARTAGSKTASGAMIGTPAYMAPEQIAGRPAPSAKTDVFALGELLYELLAGARVYRMKTVNETVRAKLRGEVPQLALSGILHADRFLSLIYRCLAFEQTERPTLKEMQVILQKIAAEAPRDGGDPTRFMLGDSIPAHETGATQPVPEDSTAVLTMAPTKLQPPPTPPLSPKRRSGLYAGVLGFVLVSAGLAAMWIKGSKATELATSARPTATPSAYKAYKGRPLVVPKTRTLKIESTPAGAIIKGPKGQTLGSTPYVLQLPMPEGALELQMSGHHSQRIEASALKGDRVHIKLQPIARRPSSAKPIQPKRIKAISKDDFPSW